VKPQREAVFTLLDFFERRTGRLYFYINSIEKLKTPVLDEMSAAFQWEAPRKKEEIDALDAALYRATHFEKSVDADD